MNTVNITFIGTGAAASVTLVELFERLLKQEQAAHKLSIAVIERRQELWRGVPYGSRSSVNALTITSVHDFLHENEKAPFYEWLKANKDDWAAYYREHGGITAARWLENNMQLIDNNEWKTVYIPRFLFGRYIQQKLNKLIKAAEEKQLAEITIINAEAIDVKVLPGGLHEVIYELPDKTLSQITTHKVVIATGSAPVKTMCDIPDDKALYINDVYEPSTNENLDDLQKVLNKVDAVDNRNVLIIGSNASSIEILYLLEGIPELRKLINKIVIISPSGILPHHTNNKTLPDHPMPHLDKVAATGDYNIQTLSDAAAADVKLALQDGAHMDYIATIIGNTLKLMEVLGEDAKKEFYAIHAIRLRNMFRRAGGEYKSVAQSFLDMGKVTMLKGGFSGVASFEKGAVLTYKDSENGKELIYPLQFTAIINCTGSGDLNESSSRLLYNLTNNGTCKMNLSRKGFVANEKFEVGTNFYIMGPLLGGNVNKLIHFWQLENVIRLTYLAPYLVDELVKA